MPASAEAVAMKMVRSAAEILYFILRIYKTKHRGENMKFHPYIAGWGMAGKGMAKALEIIKIINPDLNIAPPTLLKKTQSLQGLADGKENPLLLIGNPHGLHAQMILDGEAAGFRNIISDKPVCIRKEDIAKLRQVKADVGVTHGFRQNWGPQ